MEEGRAVAIAIDGDQQARVGPEHLSTLMSMNDIKVARSDKSSLQLMEQCTKPCSQS